MKLDGNTPINLSITLDMTNTILGALSALPYERVAGIIAQLQSQAAPQVAAAQAPKAAVPAAADPVAQDELRPE